MRGAAVKKAKLIHRQENKADKNEAVMFSDRRSCFAPRLCDRLSSQLGPCIAMAGRAHFNGSVTKHRH